MIKQILNGKYSTDKHEMPKTKMCLIAGMLIVLVCLGGCTKGGNTDVTPTPAQMTSTPTPAPTATPMPTATPVPTATPTPTPVPRVQDTFEAMPDEGVYVKNDAFLRMSYADINMVGDRLILVCDPMPEEEPLTDEPEEGGALDDGPGEDEMLPEEGEEYEGDEPYYDEYEGDDPYYDDYYDDYYGEWARYKGNTLLRSIDPATMEYTEYEIEGMNAYYISFETLDNDCFAVNGFMDDSLHYVILDKMLNVVREFDMDYDLYYRMSPNGRYLWYIDSDTILRCYDDVLGELVEIELPIKKGYYYFNDSSDRSVLIVHNYDDDDPKNYYYDPDTLKYLGESKGIVRYAYSEYRNRAVGVSGDGSYGIEVYECSPANLFPGEEIRTDDDAEASTAAVQEPLCRIAIENTSETYDMFIDWERNCLITSVYYYGPRGRIFEYSCYSMLTGQKLSNYVMGDLGDTIVYHTLDADKGLLHVLIRDSDSGNCDLYAWEYSADTVREYKNAFKKYTDIPEEVEARRRELEDKYGFYIYLGSEVFASSFDYDLKLYKDYDSVLEQMDVIDEVLSIYPEGFFEQFKYGGIKTLSIYLCGGFVKRADVANTISDAIALACVFGYERALALDLNWSWCLKRTIVHELSHWIDGRINSGGELGGYADYENDWLEVNPDDYTYKYSYESGRTIWKYIYSAYGDNSNTYFIDEYSQTYPTEDRARLFEYLMYNDDDYYDYIAVPNLQNKLKFYFEAIRKGFDTTGWPEKTVWEEELEKKIEAAQAQEDPDEENGSE